MIEPIKEANKKWHDKQIKLKRSFRIKVILPNVVIAIIGISVFAHVPTETNIGTTETNIGTTETNIGTTDGDFRTR